MVVDGLKDQAKRVATIGDFIRDQREQAQVSMRQLAQRAGVSNPYLSQIERGLRKPSAEILQQIAKGLLISTEQLYLHAGILVATHIEPSESTGQQHGDAAPAEPAPPFPHTSAQ